MRLKETPIGNIIKQYQDNNKTWCRNIYVTSATYIASLSDLIQLNQHRIAQLDSEADGTNRWPHAINDDLINSFVTVSALLTYKAVPFDIGITRRGEIYMKFPTVSMDVLEIYAREKRDWKRAGTTYYRHDPPEKYELAAFLQHRLPTIKELQEAYGTVKTTTKTFYNSVTARLEDTDILAKIEDAFRRYASTTKRAVDSKKKSEELVIQQYIKLRGKGAYDRWRVTQVPEAPALKL